MSQLLAGARVMLVPGERGETAFRFLASLGATAVNDIAAADILIGSRAADFRAGGPHHPTTLRKTNPRLVTVSLTPFGLEGPYADYDGPEIVVSAMGGPLGEEILRSTRETLDRS